MSGGRQWRSLQERVATEFFVDDNGCHLWTGALDRSGYGRVSSGSPAAGNYVQAKAHRVAYEMLVGPIPEDLVPDHLCRVRRCINPDHIELVTVRENVLRGIGLAAMNARKTHCKRGHEFTPENTHILPSGARRCRRCTRDKMRAARQGLRAS